MLPSGGRRGQPIDLQVEALVSFRKLISALFVGALFLLTPAAMSTASAVGPYPPPTAEGSGSVSESRVEAGGCVTFSGTGFEPNTAVVIRDNGRYVATVRADSNGDFSYRICFGAGAKRGKHTLTGTGAGAGGSGELTVTAVVTVTGVSQRPGDNGGDNGGGIPFTGFTGSGIALGGIALVAAGSALLIASERRHRTRRRTARVPA